MKKFKRTVVSTLSTVASGVGRLLFTAAAIERAIGDLRREIGVTVEVKTTNPMPTATLLVFGKVKSEGVAKMLFGRSERFLGTEPRIRIEFDVCFDVYDLTMVVLHDTTVIRVESICIGTAPIS